MKINQKRNLFVFVSLLLGLIYFVYFNLAILPDAFNNLELMQAYVAALPHVITLGIAVCFNYVAYRNYTPKKMTIALGFYVLTMFLYLPISAMMVFPAVVTSILALVLKINQDSTKFVGR